MQRCGRTGLRGMGRNAGRGMGICAEPAVSKDLNTAGLGSGRGFKRMQSAVDGCGKRENKNAAFPGKGVRIVNEILPLKKQLAFLEDRLATVEKRIADFEKQVD